MRMSVQGAIPMRRRIAEKRGSCRIGFQSGVSFDVVHNPPRWPRPARATSGEIQSASETRNCESTANRVGSSNHVSTVESCASNAGSRNVTGCWGEACSG